MLFACIIYVTSILFIYRFSLTTFQSAALFIAHYLEFSPVWSVCDVVCLYRIYKGLLSGFPVIDSRRISHRFLYANAAGIRRNALQLGFIPSVE